MNYVIKSVSVFFLVTLILLSSACTESETPATSIVNTSTNPDVIRFKRMALYPEGLEYDASRNSFLVTSLREGVIGEVKDDGTYKVLAKDPHMVSAIGIRIDAARDRFLVCNSDPGVSIHTDPKTQGKLAGLAVFRLSTGKLIKYLNLAKGLEGSHFCNDIALDKNGTAYISDSFSPVIYKVDKDYRTSVLLNNKRFSGEGFSLNGIVVKDDYLIVSKANEGKLFKVPLRDPEKFSQIKIDSTFKHGDGLLWAPDGSLIVIANVETRKVLKLTSTDNWASAKITGSADTGQVYATTGVIRDGKIYVLHAMLHVLFNPKTEKHVEHFEIHRQNL